MGAEPPERKVPTKRYYSISFTSRPISLDSRRIPVQIMFGKEAESGEGKIYLSEGRSISADAFLRSVTDRSTACPRPFSHYASYALCIVQPATHCAWTINPRSISGHNGFDMHEPRKARFMVRRRRRRFVRSVTPFPDRPKNAAAKV